MTWQWNRLADNVLQTAVANYTGMHQGRTIFPDANTSPQVIVMTPGLHIIGTTRVSPHDYRLSIMSLLAQLRNITQAQKALALEPTRFVFQDITAVDDAHIPEDKRRRINETMVNLFQAELQDVFKETLKFNDSASWLRWLPANRLTGLGQKLGNKHRLVVPYADGVHYGGGFQNTLIQLHLYFMRSDAAASFCYPQELS